MKPGRARPFSVLQQRLGRKKVSEQMLREIPVAYLVFDVLYAGGELLIDRPLRERAQFWMTAARKKERHHRDTEARRKIRNQGKLIFGGEKKSQRRSIIRAPVFHASRRRNWKNCLPRRRLEATKA